MNQLLRWGLGFTFTAPAAAPLLAQSAAPLNASGATLWTLVVLPLLAMLGNALGGVLLELTKGALALWRAKVRSRIRAMGEDPDSPMINAAPVDPAARDASTPPAPATTEAA